MPEALVKALDDTGYAFAHHAWSKATAGDFGIYTEFGENSLYADNRHAERAAQVAVHYYTRDDSGAPKAAIETALDSVGAAWYLEAVMFESDTGFIHYEWAVEL